MSATSLWFDEPIEGYRKSGKNLFFAYFREQTTNEVLCMFFSQSLFKQNLQNKCLGFIKFMNEVVKFPDVFFVSAKDAIDWTRNPVGLDQRPFSC